MRKLVSLSTVVFLALGAVACGASGGSDGAASSTTTKTAETTTTETGRTTTTGGGGSSASAYADALEEQFTSGDESGGDLVFTKQESSCLAPKWIDIIGADTFEAKRVTPTDLTDSSFDYSSLKLAKSQAQAMIDATGDCDIDLYSKFIAAIEADLTPAQTTCVENNLDRGSAERLLVAALYRDTLEGPLGQELQRIDSECKLSDSSGGAATAGTITAPSATTTSAP